MRILLDTHIALWAIADSSKLSPELRELVASRENVVYYSLASVWEVAIKHAIRPENMPIPEERFVELCERTGFVQLPITAPQLCRIKDLSRPDGAPRHNDPFDRLLIAQAKEEGLVLVTHDALLPWYGESCVRWF